VHHIHTWKIRPQGRSGTSSLPDPEAPRHLSHRAVREAAAAHSVAGGGRSGHGARGKRGVWEGKATAPALPGSVPRACHSSALTPTPCVQNRAVPPLLPRVQGLAAQAPSLAHHTSSKSTIKANGSGIHRFLPATRAQAGCPTGTWAWSPLQGTRFLC